jgi:enterochelin esterase-like enzyme
MGGLISTYAVLAHTETFGGAGVFSASFWFNPQLEDYVMEHPLQELVNIYFLVGGMEGPEQSLDTMLMYELINEDKENAPNLRLVVASGGGHNEGFWRSELAAFLIWLLGC